MMVFMATACQTPTTSNADPCVLFTCENAVFQEADVGSLADCRHDIGEEETEDITNDQSAEDVGDEVNAPQQALAANSYCSSPSASQQARGTLIRMVPTTAYLKVN
ncbi:MAG: hypothetical protein ACLUSL_04695 [Ruminococcus sp.]